jgi:5-methylcytosine-specific restriction endonuclease McrA
MPRARRKYTREILAEAVAASTSVAGVLRHLGLPQAGGTHAHLSRTIKAFEIDTSHFVRHQNGAAKARRTAAEILVVLPFGHRRENPRRLRRALIEIGRDFECALCRNPGLWQGRSMILVIDHVNGDFHDNRASNLRFLCPNCHAQTANFAGRGRGRWADPA